MNLREAEDIKKRWGECTEELYKKDLHDPEYEVKWALGSITTDKASGGDGIPVDLFQILEDVTAKLLHAICQQIWKTQQWPEDWKMSVSFQSQRRAMPKNAQTTTRFHSFHMLVK